MLAILRIALNFFVQYAIQVISIGVRGANMNAALVIITYEDTCYEDKEEVSKNNPAEVFSFYFNFMQNVVEFL